MVLEAQAFVETQPWTTSRFNTDLVTNQVRQYQYLFSIISIN